MRKTALFTAIFVAAFAAIAAARPAPDPARPAAGPELKGRLSLSGAWALYPLALKWAEEFQKLHPGVRIDVQAGGAGKGIADALAGVVDVGMVSRDINPAETAKGALAVAVAKDAVVPTVSRSNPFLAEILRRGIKKGEFAAIWVSQTIASWGELLGRKAGQPIHVYTRSDACGAAETWAAYLGKRQEDLNGIGVYGDPGVAEAVKRDPLGIGFNNINFAYDARTKRPVEGLEICPIDLDGNGTLDPRERVYDSRDDIIKAIAADVYPSPPARELFFVLKGKPQDPLLAEFLRWVLEAGQAFVPDAGYLPLSKERLARGLAAIGGPDAPR
ncbi:MAG TPA: substrate-binding domain-containing protein [Burkholderiales bacterium]|nr:substrate-binding domain-containing protein [Burkholderiales bacterium]